MIYGDPQIHIEDDHTDRIGIRTLILSRLWQPSRWPLSLAELDGEKPDIPAVPGGVMLIGEQTRRVSGALRTSWTFEGINGDGKDVTFKDRSNSPDYSFAPGFSQIPMAKHPRWPDLQSAWGGQVVDGQVIWPEFIGASGGSGPRKSDSAGKRNPLFGHDDFIQIEGTYSFRYASSGYGSAMTGVGKIATSLPGNPPTVQDGRNWLKGPSPVQRRGPVYEITEVYWLSGEDGWSAQIYSDDPTASSGGFAGFNG